MDNNLPLQTYGKENEGEIDIHEQAGLVSVGVDEDGNIEWQGTNKQWNEYERLNAETN